MTSVVIDITVALFFFLPYYLRIFLIDNKKVRYHIGFWIVLNCIAVALGFNFDRDLMDISLIVFVLSLLYYFFTYIFYVRHIEKDTDKGTVQWLVNLKHSKKIFQICLILIGIITVVEVLFISLKNEASMPAEIYLKVLIVIGYIQTVLYSKECLRLVNKGEQ